MDEYVDDMMACGANGIISEPYIDYKAIARRYSDCFLAGEGDNQVLIRNDPAEICGMVDSINQLVYLSTLLMFHQGCIPSPDRARRLHRRSHAPIQYWGVRTLLAISPRA